MEPKLIEANGEDFIIHFKEEGSPDYKMRWSGTVNQIEKFDDETWRHQSSEPTWLEWSFCWRGIWEGRVYFKREEYWGEEMETIAQIWRQIEDIVKGRIKSDNPDYKHFDD